MRLGPMRLTAGRLDKANNAFSRRRSNRPRGHHDIGTQSRFTARSCSSGSPPSRRGINSTASKRNIPLDVNSAREVGRPPTFSSRVSTFRPCFTDRQTVPSLAHVIETSIGMAGLSTAENIDSLTASCLSFPRSTALMRKGPPGQGEMTFSIRSESPLRTVWANMGAYCPYGPSLRVETVVLKAMIPSMLSGFHSEKWPCGASIVTDTRPSAPVWTSYPAAASAGTSARTSTPTFPKDRASHGVAARIKSLHRKDGPRRITMFASQPKSRSPW